jgi:tocopherol cyclase
VTDHSSAVLARSYRATGADLPLGDPAAAHRVPFEGYFWRIVDERAGAVVVALSAVCRGPAGPWGLSTLAAHPGGFSRTVITRTAEADGAGFGVRAEGVLRGDATRLSVDMGPDARLEASLREPVRWPRRAFGALGAAHAIPRLPQYWHPVVLRAGVSGRVRAGDLALELDGATGYAEKNWGRGFPGRWWWGHAASFGDDVSLSFAGGRVTLLGVDVAPTAVVLRLGRRVVALAPPRSRTRVAAGDGEWRLRTQGRGLVVEIAGDAGGGRAHELLVPLPAEQRGELRSRQHLAGALSLRVTRGRRVLYDGCSPLAGLELGAPSAVQ